MKLLRGMADLLILLLAAFALWVLLLLTLAIAPVLWAIDLIPQRKRT